MSNRWGIPLEVEQQVLKRDKSCVYCGISFSIPNPSRKIKATWEHIINDIRINNLENIALSCGSCNASKGSKTLTNWLKSSYCQNKGITLESVSAVVKQHIVEK